MLSGKQHFSFPLSVPVLLRAGPRRHHIAYLLSSPSELLFHFLFCFNCFIALRFFLCERIDTEQLHLRLFHEGSQVNSIA